jgi:tRNA1Val (adenine37-N6)-methyltransferase
MSKLDYEQPDFYHLNQDSIHLVRWILEKEKSRTSLKILDLGAGCGIIGIEVSRVLNPVVLTFVELQEDYGPYLKKNVELFLTPSLKTSFHFKSFKDWQPEELYELIVCNPPYYLPGHGQLPADPRRAIARTFLKDNWCVLIQAISRSLAREGKAYLVVKNEALIINEIEKAVAGILNLEKNMEQEQGLVLYRLTRLDIEGCQ